MTLFGVEKVMNKLCTGDPPPKLVLKTDKYIFIGMRMQMDGAFFTEGTGKWTSAIL